MKNDQQIRSELQYKNAQIALKEAEIKILKQEEFELELKLWKEVSWEGLANYLKDNPNSYDCNPVVRNNYMQESRYTYCKLNDKGELELGGYYHNDRFPRGSVIYIRRDRQSWKGY